MRGDGLLASLILERRPDAEICGIDVLVRENTKIPVKQASMGRPYRSRTGSSHVVMFVDVLHHTVGSQASPV